MDPAAVDLSPLESAVRSLAQAVEATQAQVPGTVREIYRDASIYRFRFTFELSWKSMRRVLLALGQADMDISPKPILRRAGQEGFIDDVEEWFNFLEVCTSATYNCNEHRANSTFAAAHTYAKMAQALVKKLRTALEAA
jgi:nucleotidyltransferase substrate binding protein (TIGR01987 family)